MTRTTPFIVALSLAAGCVADPRMSGLGAQRVQIEDAEGTSSAPPPPPPVRAKVSMSEHAQTYRNAQLCEQAAQALRRQSPKKAWAFLRACAERPDFTELDLVLRGPWMEDVRRYEKAGVELMSQIVAHRGGNLMLDLSLLREGGVQLFELGTAIENSEVFRGRYVLLRGKVKRLMKRGHTHQLQVMQTTLQAENDKARWSYSAAYRERQKGRSRDAVDGYDASSGQVRRELVVGTRTRSAETNRQFVAFLEEPPKTLREGDELLFLVRYEELTAPPEGDGAPDQDVQTALCAVVAHFRPLDALP